MPEPQIDRDDVEVLAAEFIGRRRAGGHPSITDYVTAHPQLADEIRELFPTIAAMERLKASRERASGANFGSLRLERLGEYRILREIGRGGMGIVFQAEQESLRRHVAVKVLPRHALLGPGHSSTFPARGADRRPLGSSNIVSVFGVGENDGFHYYVMQYIAGVGLDKIIARLGGSPQ